MALLNCPECGKEISDKAESCPNCGYPINECINYDVYEAVESEIEMKESVCSILSLIFYVLGVIASIVKSNISVVFSLISFILVIISHFQKKTKCVCATIVFWLMTIGIILWIVVIVVLLAFT